MQLVAPLQRREGVGAFAVVQRMDVVRQHGWSEIRLHQPRAAAEKRRLADEIGVFRAAVGGHRRLAVDPKVSREILSRRGKVIGFDQRHRDGEPRQSLAGGQLAAG